MNTEFRLDKTSFQAMTLKEADKTTSDYSHLSWQERLAVANYLSSVAYNFPLNNPPAMDRTSCTSGNMLNLMNQVKIILTFITLTTFFVGCQQREDIINSSPVQQTVRATTNLKDDTCKDKHDTTFHLHFSKDTSTKDFYQLLNFIENKGEFSRYDKKHKITSSTNNILGLQKILCYKKFYDSPMETWLLDNIFSIRYLLTSPKPLNTTKDLYPRFTLVQYNFKTEKEKEIAYLKIKEIRWGDPLIEKNEYRIIAGKKRILLLTINVPIFTEIVDKYCRLLKTQWLDKKNL